MLLKEAQQLLHALMIDFLLGAKKPIQGHMQNTKFTRNQFLFFVRAHAAKLGDKFPKCEFSSGGFGMFCTNFPVMLDQGAGIALELLERVPVRGSRIARAVLCPIKVGGVVEKQGLAIFSQQQREVRIAPNELGEQVRNLVRVDIPSFGQKTVTRVPALTFDGVRISWTMGSCLI